MSELIVLLEGREVGRVRQLRGKLSFAYAASWRKAQGAYPLSISMPLALIEHPHSAIEPFLWGLLPDNELVLQRWATQFQVSARNVFRLIAEVGEDCAGAVQFVTEERLEVLRQQKAPQIQWLSETEVASRLRELKTDASAMRAPRDLGQFSLAGAQPKTALLFDGKRWGVPSGRTPTTHILKPTTAEFDGHAENEHFCLSLARAVGLATATTEVRHFENTTAIVVTRYDRVGDTTFRVHQEDMCQALGLHPSRKYQNDGGPGPSDIVKLLRANISSGALVEDVVSFIKALLFNWLIGGTDAHAKNYSILIGGGGIVRLAPLYDIVSILPYPHIDLLSVKLAMKVGREYRLSDIGWRQWQDLAKSIRMPMNDVITMGRSMAENLPDLIETERRRALSANLKHPIINRLANMLTQRARQVLNS